MLHKMEDPTPGSSEDPSMEQKNQFKNKITPPLGTGNYSRKHGLQIYT
jgi:hypothetical protein